MNRSRLTAGCHALAWCLLSALPGSAGETAAPPGQAHVEIAGALYRLDVAVEADCSAWTLWQAQFPGQAAAGSVPGDAPPDLAHYVGARPEDVLRRTGWDVRRVPIWTRDLVYRQCLTAAGVSIEHATPEDDVAYVVSRSGADVRVAVNGRPQPASAAAPPELEQLASRLNDPEAYGRAVQALVLAAGALEREGVAVALPQGGACGLTCLKCAGKSLGLIVGGTSLLVAGCGGAPATLGASCIGAMALYAGGVVDILDECLECCICKGGCGSGGAGPGGGSSGGTAPGAPNCEEGYHACCTMACCSDSQPPTCCLPPCS